MSWEVNVNGPEGALDELAHAFKSDELTIAKGDSQGQFLLRGSTFEKCADVDAVRAEAQRIIENLSGISRILLGSEQPLLVGNITEVMPDGQRNRFMSVDAGIFKITGQPVSVLITRADGTIEEHRPSDPAPKWLEKALANPEAARALRLRNVAPLSWTDLYRLFEVIEHALGGEKKIIEKQWASRNQLERFTRTANSVAAAGDAARHGVEKWEPPTEPMTLSEARALVDILLSRWLGSEA